MLATLGTFDALRTDVDWCFELKWDGVRAVAYIDAGEVTLLSRTEADMTVTYPELHPLGRALAGHSAVLDGEIVTLDKSGLPSFRRLQQRMHVADAPTARARARRDPAVLLLFDVMVLDGRSLLRNPYTDRRLVLEALGLTSAAWQTPPTFASSGDDAVAFSRERRMEGVIAKRSDSAYTPGRRSPDWVKIKNLRTQEVVIGGWAPGRGRRSGTIGALLLGIPGDSGLEYVGKVGTGFSDGALRELHSRLSASAASASPFRSVPNPIGYDARWVVPDLVGEVAFAQWTADGRMRHPTWRGLRPDKHPSQVTKESARG